MGISFGEFVIVAIGENCFGGWSSTCYSLWNMTLMFGVRMFGFSYDLEVSSEAPRHNHYCYIPIHSLASLQLYEDTFEVVICFPHSLFLPYLG